MSADTQRTRSFSDLTNEAGQELDELKAAFAGVGIKLPSLRLDLVSLSDAGPDYLFELGRCNREVTRQLISVLKSKKEEITKDAGENAG